MKAKKVFAVQKDLVELAATSYGPPHNRLLRPNQASRPVLCCRALIAEASAILS